MVLDALIKIKVIFSILLYFLVIFLVGNRVNKILHWLSVAPAEKVRLQIKWFSIFSNKMKEFVVRVQWILTVKTLWRACASLTRSLRVPSRSTPFLTCMWSKTLCPTWQTSTPNTPRSSPGCALGLRVATIWITESICRVRWTESVWTACTSASSAPAARPPVPLIGECMQDMLRSSDGLVFVIFIFRWNADTYLGPAVLMQVTNHLWAVISIIAILTLRWFNRLSGGWKTLVMRWLQSAWLI